jgi:hypothetical protein
MQRLLPLFDYAGAARLWLVRNDWLVDRFGAPAAYLVRIIYCLSAVTRLLGGVPSR